MISSNHLCFKLWGSYSPTSVIGVSADVIKQQLAPWNLWSRAKDQGGMVKSSQLTGANDVTSGPKSGEYQETNKVVKGQSLVLHYNRYLFTSDIIL